MIFLWKTTDCLAHVSNSDLRFRQAEKIFQMTPWAHVAPKVHSQVKVMYWKCHFLSALHFPEIEGSRFETARLQRFSLKSVIFLWKTNEFLKILVQSFDFPLKNAWCSWDSRSHLWCSFGKHIIFLRLSFRLWFSFENNRCISCILGELFDSALKENKWLS